MTSARAKELLYDSETILRLVANELAELREELPASIERATQMTSAMGSPAMPSEIAQAAASPRGASPTPVSSSPVRDTDCP